MFIKMATRTDTEMRITRFEEFMTDTERFTAGKTPPNPQYGMFCAVKNSRLYRAGKTNASEQSVHTLSSATTHRLKPTVLSHCLHIHTQKR